MTKKYTKLLAPYCLGLSLLAAGNTYASTDLGDTGITLSGGAEIVAIKKFAQQYDFGKTNGGRYFNKNEYFRLDLTLTGEHNLGIFGDTSLVWKLDNSFYNTDVSSEFAKEAFIGLKTNFGTLQAGRFNTFTDNNIDYGQTSGAVFQGDNAIIGEYSTTETIYVSKYKQAIRYILPDNLIEGLTAGVLVAADTNANLEKANINDKALNVRYPWGFDTLIKYTHADSGVTVLGTYAETYNTRSDGTPLLKNDYPKKTNYKVGVIKVAYNKNNLQATAGYRNFYYKYYKVAPCGNNYLGLTTSKRCYGIVTNQNYALALDIGYTMGNHFVSVGYETAPKTFVAINKNREMTGHVARQQVSAQYTYNFTENLYVDILVEHFFDNRSKYDEKKTPEKQYNYFVNESNSFIKRSNTMLTTKLKYSF